MEAADPATAARLLAALDHTNLAEASTPAEIEAYCREAAAGPPHPAAICVWPVHTGTARRALDRAGGTRIAVAAVANFPDGGSDADRAVAEAQRAIAAGAGEIDVVYPWRAHLDGNRQSGERMLQRLRDACGARALKAIIETGELGDPRIVRELCATALAGGADFIKTSTGRSRVGATPEAARTILEVLRAEGRGGIKVAGGIRTLADAAAYLALADEFLGPEWATPAHFRIGASRLIVTLRAAVGTTERN